MIGETRCFRVVPVVTPQQYYYIIILLLLLLFFTTQRAPCAHTHIGRDRVSAARALFARSLISRNVNAVHNTILLYFICIGVFVFCHQTKSPKSHTAVPLLNSTQQSVSRHLLSFARVYLYHNMDGPVGELPI